MSFEELMGRLDPKTAKRVKTAQSIELTKYPLASLALTNGLNGGIGAGRLTTCYGNTSAGKTALFLKSIGMWQRDFGLSCAFVDSEGTYEKSWGKRMGINNDELILIQSKSSGRIEKETVPLLQAGLDILVVDSISQILPEVFIEKDGVTMSENRKQLGAHAKAITNLTNGLLYVNENTAIVYLSQTTTHIDPNTGMVKQIPHGGQKVPFASTQMIRLKSSSTENSQIKGELTIGDRVIEQPIGRKVEWLVEKNKLGRQHTKGSYDFYYAGETVGPDLLGEVFDLSETFGLMEKAGSWYTNTLTGERLQGRKQWVNLFKKDESEFVRLRDKVDAILKEESAAADAYTESDDDGIFDNEV
jgi:recombination protein RecA